MHLQHISCAWKSNTITRQAPKTTPECYAEHDIQGLPGISWNKGKQLFAIIGNARVTYTFYPSGTVNIEVKCSGAKPFKLEIELDRSRILVFFEQLRDRSQ